MSIKSGSSYYLARSKFKVPLRKLPITGDSVPGIAFGAGTKHRVKKRTDPTLGMDIADESLVQILVNSLKAGFRHLDTAEFYLTRIEVGKAIKQSGLDRSEVWVTDKYDPGWHLDDGTVFFSNSPTGPYDSIKKGLKLMGLDSIDLFLIHGPYFGKNTSSITLKEAWKQMEQIKAEGLAKNIGVSNFDDYMLEELFQYVDKYPPQVDQVEYHLYQQEPRVIEFCKAHNMLVEGYAPLTPMFPSKVGENRPLEPVIKKLCEKYKVEPNQLLLRWVLQSGVLPITTSSNYDRMKNTFKVFDFEIDEEDFQLMKKTGEKFPFRAYFCNAYHDKVSSN